MQTNAKMDYFPLFLDLKQQACLVVGAGEIAARKIELLARAGAQITVVSLEIGETVAKLHKTHSLVIKQRGFEETDLDGIRLVVSATNNRQANIAIAEAAKQKKSVG